MNPEALLAMRDPLGAPVHPGVVQVLLVVTYVLHIFFVTTAIGSLALGLYGLRRPEENWQRLAQVAVRLAVQATGLGITMGIAPLLFVQVIYDPAWYSATTLMGLWTTLFIPVVALGYLLLYVLYLRGNAVGVGYVSLALLLLAGFIMHSLASAGLYPSRFLEWYAPGGVADTSGTRFHGYNLPRFAALLFGQAALSLGDASPLRLVLPQARGRARHLPGFCGAHRTGCPAPGGRPLRGLRPALGLYPGKGAGFAPLLALVAWWWGGFSTSTPPGPPRRGPWVPWAST